MDPFLSVEQVAERWKIEPTLVIRLAEEGILQAVQEGNQWRFPAHSYAADPSDGTSPADIEQTYREHLRIAPSSEHGEVWVIGQPSDAPIQISEPPMTLHAFESTSVPEGIRLLENVGEIPVLRHYRHKLVMRDDHCHLLNPADVMLVGDYTGDHKLYRVTVRVHSEAEFTGSIRFTLAADSALTIRTGQHGEVLAGTSVDIVTQFDPAYANSLFDGAILARPDTRIFVTVPKQEGLSIHAEDILVIRDDFQLDISHVRSKSLLERTALRFEFAHESDSEEDF